MAAITKPHTFVDDTDAEAAQVNADFDTLYNWVNGQGMHRDASLAFTAIPSGPATDPTADNQFARKAYVDIPRYVATFTANPLPGSTTPAALNVNWSVQSSRQVERKAPAGNTDGFRVLRSGLYMVGIYVNYATNATEGTRGVSLLKNGAGAPIASDVDTGGSHTAGFGEGLTAIAPITLAANDTIDARYALHLLGANTTGRIWAFGVPGTMT